MDRTTPPTISQRTAVLIPLASFESVLQARAEKHPERSRPKLEKQLVDEFITSSKGARVVVVAPAHYEDVQRYALVQGARFIATDESDVSSATNHALSELHERGYDRIVVATAQVFDRQQVTALADSDDVVVVTNNSGEDTIALSLPKKLTSQSGFSVTFDEDGVTHIQEAASEIGLSAQVVSIDELGEQDDMSTTSRTIDVSDSRMQPIDVHPLGVQDDPLQHHNAATV